MRLFPLVLMCSKREDGERNAKGGIPSFVRRRSPKEANHSSRYRNSGIEPVIPERRTVQCRKNQIRKVKSEERKPREEVAARMYKAARESKNVVAVTIH